MHPYVCSKLKVWIYMSSFHEYFLRQRYEIWDQFTLSSKFKLHGFDTVFILGC